MEEVVVGYFTSRIQKHVRLFGFAAWRRDDSVDIETRLGSGISEFWQVLRIFSKMTRAAVVPPPPMGTVGSVLGLKWLGREADNSLSSRYEFKYAWSSTSISYISSWCAL